MTYRAIKPAVIRLAFDLYGRCRIKAGAGFRFVEKERSEFRVWGEWVGQPGSYVEVEKDVLATCFEVVV